MKKHKILNMTSTDYIRKYADQNGLPIMDQLTFERITNNIGKDQFRLDLADYIEKYRPVFPLMLCYNRQG